MSTPVYYPNAAAWTTPVEVLGSGRRIHPIRNDTTTYQIQKEYVVGTGYYTPEDLSTPIEDNGTPLYLVEEMVTNRTAAFVYFSRLYSTIPSTRVEYESYPYLLPGMAESSTLGTSVALFSGNPYIPGKFIFTVTAGTHAFTTSDLLRFDLVLDYSWAGTWGVGTFASGLTRTIYAKPIEVGANTITIAWNESGYTFDSGTVRSADVRPPRAPITRSITSRLTYDYILPGVTPGFDSGDDITVPDAFIITDSADEQTDTLSTTTLPTQATYETFIEDGTWLVTEAFIRLWQGGIYERIIRAIKAQ